MRFRYGHLLLWLAILMPVAMARDYYVAPNGSDANVGTLALPFQTIQKAAAVAVPGDSVSIRAGTYRETVTPARSGTPVAPITFQPYNGESVTVSGADVIPSSSWTPSSGNIYRAPITWDLGEGNNQIFLDGQMMIEARWPNTTLDVSHPTVALTSSGSYVDGASGIATGTITGLTLPSKPTNYWNGATIHISPFNVTYNQGPGWSWQSGTVVGSTAGQLSFTWTRWVTIEVPNPLVPGPKNPFYLTGKLTELDAAGEWFLDSSTSTLYFWTPGGDGPALHLVEAKRRQAAFNLNARSFITIQGINVFAATITSDVSSQYLVLDGLKAQYVSHYSLIPTKSPQVIGVADTGILLNGRYNVLRNSTIAFSAGNGVAVAGVGHRVFNNVVHDADYVGGYPAPIASAYKPTSDTIIGWNTVYNAGRFGILHSAGGDSFTNGRILHNEVYNCGLQTSDMGCMYTFGSDGKGTEIAYNLIHQEVSQNLMFGVYFDFDSSNHVAHHNVVWGTQGNLRMNTVSRNNKIYNNTLAASLGGLIVNPGVDGITQMPGSEVKNNIFTSLIGGNATPANGLVLQNNILVGTDPQFVNAAQGNFQLKPASPAIGAGLVIAPYTDGFTGKNPDAGAYDHGLPPFRAGGGQPIVTGQSAASYGLALAPDSIAFGFGPQLATGSGDAVSTTLPKSLAGSTVTVTDGVGVDRLAALIYVRPTYVAFVVPPDTAPGIALITVTSADGTISLGSAPIFATAPALFSANSSGSGVAAGLWIRVAANGAQTWDYLFDKALPPNRVPVPVDLGPAGDQVFLSLYGSAFRGASASTATVGGVNVPVSAFGAVGVYQGEDFINLGPLPRSLAGRGQVDVVITFDSKAANTVTASIR